MKPTRALRIGMLGVSAALFADEVMAQGGLGGRFWLTYQNADNPLSRQEYFIQHYEASLRDRLLDQNDLVLTFYFDNSDDLIDNLTYRRYRGNLDLSHRYYTFNARYTPRQEVTALELDNSREVRRNQLALDIHVPNLPILRLSYDTRTQYARDLVATDIRDLRGDVRYRYRFLDLQANRLNSTSGPGNELQTDVTGASVRLAPMVRPWLITDAGYEFRLSEFDRAFGPRSTVTNNSVTGVFGARYRHDAAAILAFSGRRLSTDDVVDTESRDDNVNFVLSFFENRHVRPEVSRTYILSEQNAFRTVTDYVTLQVLADGELRKGTWGRAQVTRRVDIDTQGGVLPTHIYMTSLTSRLHRGIDMRIELVANETLEDTPTTDRFQTSSLFDLYLVPLMGWTLTPHVQHNNASDDVSFVHNDRSMLGLTVAYVPSFPRMSLGLDASQIKITTGDMRDETAVAANMSFMLRARSTFNLSYGVRQTERFTTNPRIPRSELVSRDGTFNAHAQVWVARKASISINYTGVDREFLGDSDQLAVTYRQDL